MKFPLEPYMALDISMPFQHIGHGIHSNGKMEYYVRCSEPILKSHGNEWPQEWESRTNPEFLWMDNPEYTKQTMMKNLYNHMANAGLYVLIILALPFLFVDNWLSNK